MLSTTEGPAKRRTEPWIARLSPGGSDAFSLEVVAGAGELQLADSEACRVLFAGFLQNRGELATKVGEAGGSEAELIARGYLLDGETFLATLRGVYAVLLIDSRNGVALCVPEHLGRHPLFWADDGEAIIVSSSAKALIAQPSVSSAVNVLAVLDQLRRRWLFAEETMYEAVRRVPPTHMLRVCSGRRELVRFWDPAPLGEPIEWLSADEADRFGDVLETAVRRSLSDRPVGIFLSGGLDSVSVAALASASARELGMPIPWALSLVFPGPEVSEEDVQRRVAAGLGLRQVLLRWEEAVGPDGLILDALELSAQNDAPLGNFWSPAYDRLANEGKQRGCRAIMTGEGGDEWLGVSPYYAADLLRTGSIGGLFRLYRTHLRSYPVSTWAFTRNVMWQFGLRPVLARSAKRVVRRAAPQVELNRRLGRTAAGLPSWLAPNADLQAAIVDRERKAYADVLARERWLAKPLPRRYPREYLLEVATALTHPLVALDHAERFEQARRLDLPILQPFWDVDVIEFLYRTPPEVLNRAGWSKGIVRETLARRFPRLGFERQRKVSATQFARSLFREDGRRAWQAYGGVPALAAAGVVDPASANATVAGMLDNAGAPSVDRLWDLLRCEAWFRGQA
jgi:asparagine synthetase B (glutamine-hydrolysing)